MENRVYPSQEPCGDVTSASQFKSPGMPMKPRTSASTLTVPQYMAALDEEQARALKRVLALVKRTVPGCSQVISYRIPAFKLDRVFMYCAAFKSHIGIYPPVSGDARLQAALKPYANAKGNLRFPLDEPMPMALIARVAKALAKSYASGAK
jgi:uncharacterized protein YdhG (YjbR/CyaY superfamily)